MTVSRSSSRLWIAIGSIALILIGAALIIAPFVNPQLAATAPSPIAPTTATAPPPIAPTTAAALPVQISPHEPKRVSLGGARAAYELKQAVFVDVRDKDSYAKSHIPGALSIPIAELESRLNELDPNAWIITYCT